MSDLAKSPPAEPDRQSLVILLGPASLFATALTENLQELASRLAAGSGGLRVSYTAVAGTDGPAV